MRSEFIGAVAKHQQSFGLALVEEKVAQLADYYDFVQAHNSILHLVAPCSAEEFAIRHILESLTLLEHLPHNAKFVDVGTGAGLPSIPCLIVGEDLGGVLIESKEKKTAFLNDAVSTLGLADRAMIVNKQYSEADPNDAQFVTSRALDKFTEKLPHLVRWSRRRTMLLFGGPSIGQAFSKLKLPAKRQLMPMSEQRFLFVMKS